MKNVCVVTINRGSNMTETYGYKAGRAVTVRATVVANSFKTAPCGFVHVQIGSAYSNGALVLVPIGTIIEEQDNQEDTK